MHINSGTMLLIDPAIKPVDGSLVIVDHEGEFEVKRLKTGTVTRLKSLDNPEEVRLISNRDLEGSVTIIWGVVTHIINDACTDEFDDCPII